MIIKKEQKEKNGDGFHEAPRRRAEPPSSRMIRICSSLSTGRKVTHDSITNDGTTETGRAFFSEKKEDGSMRLRRRV